MEEIDMHTVLLDGGSALGFFLYDVDPSRRSSLKHHLHRLGGEFTGYPMGSRPASTDGGVTVVDATASVFIGNLRIVGPLELPMGDLGGVKEATVFVLDEPFDINDRTERVLMAATVPLEILEREET